MQKIKLEAQIERKKRFTAATVVIVVVMMLLSLLQIVLSNRLASFGDELALLTKEEKTISFENELLERDIASASAIATIAQRASDLSLVFPTKFLVINEKETVALAR